ncbi:MAG: VWA domain-containing protein [Armatimonadetes bacterium]|nr:VWA domain-containing protein [Armatimonadota bacterium]
MRLHWRVSLLFLLLLNAAFPSGAVRAQSPSPADEALTRVLDELDKIPNFGSRPTLYVVGIDASGSMSTDFDTAKQVVQATFSRYLAPGDSVYVFTFAADPHAIAYFATPVALPAQDPEDKIAEINGRIQNLDRSQEKGTSFRKARLHALEQIDPNNAGNAVIMLFSDNYSESGVTLDSASEQRLQELEKLIVSSKSKGLGGGAVDKLYLNLYYNGFPDATPLAPPPGGASGSNIRQAWAAYRSGASGVAILTPTSASVPPAFPVEARVKTASPLSRVELLIDGGNPVAGTAAGDRYTWAPSGVPPGQHHLLVRATFKNGTTREAQMLIQVGPASPTPSPGPASTPSPSPSPGAATRVRILSPSRDAVVAAPFSVKAQVEPDPAEAEKVVLRLDGEEVGAGKLEGSSHQWNVEKRLKAGEHRLQVVATVDGQEFQDEITVEAEAAAGPPVVVLLLLAAALLGTVALMGSRSVTVEVFTDMDSRKFTVSRSNPLEIGGLSGPEGKNLYTTSDLSERIALVSTAFGGKLKISKVSKRKDVRVELEDGTEVENAPVTMEGAAAIEVPTGGRTVRIEVARASSPSPSSIRDDHAQGGGDNGDDWRA